MSEAHDDRIDEAELDGERTVLDATALPPATTTTTELPEQRRDEAPPLTFAPLVVVAPLASEPPATRVPAMRRDVPSAPLAVAAPATASEGESTVIGRRPPPTPIPALLPPAVSAAALVALAPPPSAPAVLRAAVAPPDRRWLLTLMVALVAFACSAAWHIGHRYAAADAPAATTTRTQ